MPVPAKIVTRAVPSLRAVTDYRELPLVRRGRNVQEEAPFVLSRVPVHFAHRAGLHCDLCHSYLSRNIEHGRVRDLRRSARVLSWHDFREFVGEGLGNGALRARGRLLIVGRWDYPRAYQLMSITRRQLWEYQPPGKIYSWLPGMSSQSAMLSWKFFAITSLGVWANQSVS